MIGWAGQARVLPGVVVLGAGLGTPGKIRGWRPRSAVALVPGRWHHVSGVGALPCERHSGPASGRRADLSRSARRAGHRCHLPQRRTLRGEQAPWARPGLLGGADQEIRECLGR